MPKALAAIVAIAIAGGLFYYFGVYRPNTSTLPTMDNTTVEQSPANNSNSNTESSGPAGGIVNYDQCIAAGNKPLKDAPDKCITKDGYVFVQGAGDN